MGNQILIFTTTILLFLILPHALTAQLSSNSRKLFDSSSNNINNPNVTVSPNGSPVVGNDKNSNTSPPSTSGEKNPNDEQVNNITPPSKPPIDDKQHDSSPKEDGKEPSTDTSKEKVKEDNTSPNKEMERPSETCDGVERSCKDEKTMVACIKNVDSVTKAVVLLIENKGENSLKVDLTFSSRNKAMEIPKMQTKQVNVSLANAGGNEITLNAGNGYCVLHLVQGAPVNQGNYFVRWNTSYSKFMTPIYGAYLMLVITLIAGGICAICWFSKRKRTNEVPYQELEMSVPESAAVVDTAEGWDDNWDDDWDEEKAVKSPGHSISGNGLTSRTLKKSGSEDWDD